MEYISVAEAAERWKVSVRQVQRLLLEERIVGAKRHGRTWMIPEDAKKPSDMRRARTDGELGPQDAAMKALPMPLLNSRFEPGAGMDRISAMQDAAGQAIARVEYAYFKGDHQEACNVAEPYLDHPDVAIRVSALFVYAFSCITLGRIQEAVDSMRRLKQIAEVGNSLELEEEQRALVMLVNMASRVLLHMPVEKEASLMPGLCHLPNGLKLFGAYVLAHAVYLRGDYGEALGIATVALHMEQRHYVIPEIYLRLIMSMSLMNLKRIEEAKDCFMQAWSLATPDGFYQPFSEHHGLLHGLIETCLKTDYPGEYQRIISLTYKQSAGWRRIHNPSMNARVADNLTTMEFTVAMLANRGWTNVEIADHLNLSEHTVKKYISDVYQKLGISSRKQLREFMLK